MNNATDIISCYGITQDPKTNCFMMIMHYVKNGSLRHHLNNCFNSMDWNKNLSVALMEFMIIN